LKRFFKGNKGKDRRLKEEEEEEEEEEEN